MAVLVESRPELVGKRFLCVGAGGEELPENGRWRAGIIRTVSHRELRSPELSVYVEFDDLEWEKREWVKVYEDFAAFLVEYQLIWARRKDPSQSQGSKIKHIQWPALTFKPLVGKSIYSSITAVEFLVDKQLDFLSEDSAFQPYQDDIDSLNPVLRDNPQLQEEVKIWVKEQKVQEIFMQGPYSLNGYRVRVYRQDSATQWFTGIITHHDLFSRTMIVMNDQVLEPQNVDPSMVQMTFLDDVVHSLLKGENIGITSRRRSRSSQNSNTAHGHYTRAQANSPRPAMNSQNAAPKQNSQQLQRNARPNKRKGSDSSMPEEEKTKEEKYDCISHGENSKSKNKLYISKRRKPEDEERKKSAKRQRTDNTSDSSESSDSENSNKRLTDSSSEQNSDTELKSKNIVKINGKEGKSQSDTVEEKILIGNQSHQRIERPESANLELQEISLHQAELPTVYDHSDNDGCIQECRMENKHPREHLPNEQFVTNCPTPKSYIDTNTETSSVNQTQEHLSSSFSLQTGQETESPSSDSKHLFTNINILEVNKSETVENWINNANKMELMQSNVGKNMSANEHLNSENIHCGSVPSLTVISLTEEGRVRKQTAVLDAMRSKTGPQVENSKTKPNTSPEIKYKPVQSPDTVKSKVNYLNSHVIGITKTAVKTDPDLPRSSFHSISPRVSSLEATKNALPVDKKEHFTIYRDPILLGQETGTNHMTPYLHQHNYPPHCTSHRTSLNPSTHHSALTGTPHLLAESSNQTPLSAINTHPLSSASHHSVHHQHLLPAVLPGMPTASLLGGHPRLETAHASSLSHLALAHQQQLLQHQSPHLLGQTHPSTSYNHLGLYPVIWQYPNGAHAYSGLGIPSSKWVHSETSVNAETSSRRNTPSPWLHQPTPVTSSDGLGLLSHIPVRPSSAEPHRPLKLASQSSPPLSKGIVDRHKDELERKGIFESIHSAKSDLEQNRSQAAKEGHLQRQFVDPLQRSLQETGERLCKYKEEHRRILQESIEAASFTVKMKAHENEKESYSRIMPLSSSNPPNHGGKPDKESELYKMKHSLPQTLPQSNYFTTLSNSVVNEPPRTYLSKEIAGTCADKQNTCPSTTAAAAAQSLTPFTSSLSKPPPLIKHQPETESSVGKGTDQLSQQMMAHSVSSFRTNSGSPTQLTISSSGSLRTMPALHRAPVFHPPVHPNLERKEGSYNCLSPPTLTPVQPVNTGNKVHELQKPPTLVPEPKETQNIYKSVTDQKLSAIWKNSSCPNNEKTEWHMERTHGKSPSATASVIVRPPSSSKYDTVSIMQSAPKVQASERLKGINQIASIKSVEAKESGRIVVSKMNSDVIHACYEKNFPAASQGSVPSSVVQTTTVLCSTITDVITSVTTTDAPGTGSSQVTDCLPKAGLPCMSADSIASRPINKDVIEECNVSSSASITVPCSKTESLQVSTGFSGPSDFVHLKKHKAALAAAQFKINNTSDTESHTVKNLIYPASVSVDSAVKSSTINKGNTLSGGQVSQTSQANYHPKLKKAWLTRHSEEDKITNKKESSENCVSEMIKPCTVNLIASTSNDLQNNVDNKLAEEKLVKEEKHARRKTKRMYESGSESGDSDESESKSEQRTKRQPKPTYKKKQNDLQKRKGDLEEDVKPNGLLSRGAKEKTKLKLQSGNNNTGIPRSVLKDWRKVKKLKQTGESFLQDDSCYEIGPNLQKCRECRLIRSKKSEESAHSPVFCRFYYFRRLSFSKNGVVRIDGFSSPDQYDDEAMNLWTHESYEDDEMDVETCKYILEHIGDKFCQLVTSEKTAMSWVKKDAKIAWKRAVRGVREMCDACEATLFNIHWVCQKCGFVVCLDCYKAKERKSSRDKELYAWMKCVKGQPHDHKHLMPTQIIPGSVLTELVEALHTLREKHEIKSHCHCSSKQNVQIGWFPPVNGVSQILQNVLNHSNKISLCIPELQQQKPSQKSEANGNTSPGSDISSESQLNPPESQSPLHWLADLAEQKAREEKKENKDYPLGKHTKEEREQDNSESLNFKVSTPLSQNNEPGSTLRDLLTTTAGKLRLGSTDAGIAFAPVYSTGTASSKSGRTMPNILDDIIASVVENKIPPNRTSKINIKSEMKEEPKNNRKSISDDNNRLFSDIPHSWICNKHVLWLSDHENSNNWKLFKEWWKQGKFVLVSGIHKKMNASLWKADFISSDFGDFQADLLNCKDSITASGSVKEFWDGFEEISKRQKNKNGEIIVLKLKDLPSGDDFRTMMPARYEDVLKSLPLPEYCNPEGKLNLASYLPGFFVRPDLGPRLCSTYGIAAAKDHDIGTTNLHIEVSDIVNILVSVGIAKGNGVPSKSGVLKKFEEEDLDDLLRKRLKDSSELPGALWHIYAKQDAEKIKEFLHKIAKEQGLEVLPENDPIRDQSWYVNKTLRQRLFEEYGVKTCTLIQFLGDAVILPAGALHQVQNFHSCIQVIEDFVSPEHLTQSFHLTQELRLSKEEINYDDKLQIKNILCHAVKEMVRALKSHEHEIEDIEEN
ncbi:probable JmjC domain-containing histone demethylation protein 2C isoform X1 [Crotalus tigris]|uniref:probable JmjC domain-containing histone demethylation protein 2C isoform X1 n=3 Tax=Crotalus tigris TaxID=88082 RepID=UPI00192FAB96|nr:probable JmjC domain-containing histone demethylation protein 2C isoform X1 [Crotalus tigris]